MKNKAKDFFKALLEWLKTVLKSIVNSKALFSLRKYNFFFALITLVVVIGSASLPSYISYVQMTGQDLMSKLPGLPIAMNEILTKTEIYDCEIKDKKLVCDKNYDPVDSTTFTYKNDTDVKYKIMVNTIDTTQTFTPSATQKGEYDNFVMFSQNFYRARFTDRMFIDGKWDLTTYEIYGTYDELEGMNIKALQEEVRAIADETTRINWASVISANIVKGVNASGYKTILELNLVSTILSTVVFVFLASFILKGDNIFGRGRGFKFKETIKIATYATLQPLFLSFIFWLFTHVQFPIIFGFLYLARICYIYFRYLFKKDSKFYEELEQQKI